jgi:hypothetical protein
VKELGLLVTAKDKASGSLDKITGAVSGLGGVASTVATGGVAALVAGVAAVGAGAVAAGKSVWDFTSDLNSGMKTAQAQMGLTTEETEALRDSAKSVFEEGFGENISGVVEGMSEIKRVTDLEGEALETATENAITMSEVFDLDVTESIKAAQSAVGSGLAPSIEKAQDMITSGFQMGLPEDWIDTVNEYSGDFERLGYTSDQVLSMMNAGMQAGARNTDVIADGFREMNIRLMEGGKGVREAFSSMGLSFDQMQAKVASGEATWADYSTQIVGSLSQMDDKVEANRVGVELFGSKWEDVGGDVFMAAGKATDGVEDMTGATQEAGETMREGFSESVKRLKRTVISNLEPLGRTATKILDKMTPYLDRATEWLGEKIPVAIGKMERIWNKVFPEAKSIVVGLWNGIQPAVTWIRRQFEAYYSSVLPRLRGAWDTVSQGFRDAKRMVMVELVPAIRRLIDELGLGQVKTEGIMSAIGDFAGIITSTGIKALIEGIKIAISGLSWYIDNAVNIIRALKHSFESIRGVLDSIRDRFNRVKDSVRGFANSIPDWLIPGSPTPFEIGLRGVADAARSIPDKPFMGGIRNTPVGGGRTTIRIVNNFGPDSVRSDRDIMKLSDEISRKTAMRTGGLPCR